MRQTFIFIGILSVIGGLAQAMTGCGDNSDPITPNSDPSESVRVLLDEKGLQLDMENSQSTTVMGRSVSFVPLIPTEHQGARLDRKDSLQSEPTSQFLAYLDDQKLGRLFVLMEISRSQRPEMRSSIRVTFPGRGFVFSGVPSWLSPWEISEDGSSLQISDAPDPNLCDNIRGAGFLVLLSAVLSGNPLLALLGYLLYAIAVLLGCIQPVP